MEHSSGDECMNKTNDINQINVDKKRPMRLPTRPPSTKAKIGEAVLVSRPAKLEQC